VDDANPCFKCVDGVLFSKDGTVLYCCPAGFDATTYKVPDGVRTIEVSAFADNQNLEEIILPDNTRLQDIKIFSTWYPATHKFPWLMTDHCYWMSALNENIGYNQPTNTGYYLGSDLKNDAEAWAEAEKVQNQGLPMGIQEITTIPQTSTSGLSYNLSGQRVNTSYKGIVIKNGKKTFNK
jgi:hypothetical protein